MIGQLEEIQKGLTALSEKIDNQIKQRKKQELFQRSNPPLISTQWVQIGQEFDQLIQQIRLMGSGKFWTTEFRPVWESDNFLLVTFLLLFAVTAFLLFRLRRFCYGLEQRPFCRQYPWQALTLKVFHRSLPLFGITLFFQIYALLRNLNVFAPIQMLLTVLWIFVFTRWCLDTLTLWNQKIENRISNRLLFHLHFLIVFIRIFASLYAGLDWLIVGISYILLLIRMLFETGLIIWVILFRKRVGKTTALSSVEKSRAFQILHPFLKGTTYIIIGTGPLLELAGYGTFALYWYTSWFRSAIVILWGGLVFMLLRELNQKFSLNPDTDSAKAKESTYPIRWFVFQLCWVAWAGAILIFSLFAWGASQALIVAIIRLFNHPFQVGRMTLSLMGALYAFLILFFTHGTARLWRYVLKDKILVKSGMETGLQESFTTITVYILWSFGILIALNAFGLTTASLAVILGALGIGLGFGLQNIFNNFVSGIILLFERPIQVGDDIEINGIWATVKKINVRSTVVQTYDNASLIIPNSDFISSQVTNWSFKDRRIRRKIVVGVAYGSDIEQVRQTLLEIANKTPRVLRYPKPDVLFSDFADSALVFKLRIWTYVDYFLSVETDLRFEIDRLFKERNITIAFPQRDIHIHSIEKDAPVKEHQDTPPDDDNNK
jgi:potassium efflux system protein